MAFKLDHYPAGDVVRAPDAKGTPLEPDEEGTKRLPRGYEAAKPPSLNPP
jgi:hypothetical protein